MKKVFLFLFLGLCFFKAQSQNLVLNPSFEDNTKMPGMPSEYIKMVKNWNLVKGGSFYFHRNGGEYKEFVYRTPINTVGIQEPRTGLAYISVMLINEGIGYTIIQGELKEKLVKNNKYYFELYLSLVDNTNLSTSNLWVAFSDSVFRGTEYKAYYYSFPKMIVNDSLNYFRDKVNWEKFSGTFSANGGEKYFAIGSATKRINVKGENNENFRSEYYLDDVSLIDITGKFFIDENKPLVLKNIFFEIGKSELLPVSYTELNFLLEYLKNNPQKNIEISGHTDNTGNEIQNLKLSEERAKSVREYLISNGISNNIITVIGYGSSKPVDTNTNSQGKQNNRRVEVKITKN